MNVVSRDVPLHYLHVKVVADATDNLSNTVPDRPAKHRLAIFRNPDDMQMDSEDGVRAFSVYLNHPSLYGRAMLKPPPKGGGFHQRIKTNKSET